MGGWGWLACLATSVASQELSLDILKALAGLYELDENLPHRSARPEILRALTEVIFPGDEAASERILAQDAATVKNPVAVLLQDPLFEAAFVDMDNDEKFEFGEVREEQTRSKVARQLAVRQGGVKRARNGRPLRRRRGGRGGREENAEHAQEAPREEAEDAPPQPAPAPPPPPPPPPPDAAQEHPLLQRRVRGNGRVARRISWGTHFDIAPAYRDGVKSAITVTCYVHTVEGGRCNKSLTLGPNLNEEQATHFIKEWCVRGFLIPDGDGARLGHMTTWDPRIFAPDEVRSLAELDALAVAGDA